MANNDGQIVLGLDIPKTVSQINSDIKKLQNQLEQVKATGGLDTSSTVKQINAQIATLQGQLQKINIQANIDVNSASKSALQTGQQIGNAINQGVANGVQKAKSELKSFSDLTNFSGLNKKIEHLHIEPSELKNYNDILDKVKAKYAEFGQVKITNEQFKNGTLEKFKVNIEQVNGDLKETKSFMMSLNDDKDAFVFDGIIKGSESVVQHLDKTKNAVNQTADAINELKDKTKADKIQLSIDNGTYDATYNDLIAKTQQWSFQTDNVKKSIAELKAAYQGLRSDSTDEEKIEVAKRWEQAVKSVKNIVKQTKLEYATDDKISAFHQKLQEFYDKNTATHRQWGKELKQMLNATSDGAKVTNIDLETMKSKLDNINNAARQANKLGKSWFDTIRSNVQSYLPWVSMAGIIGEATQKIRTSLTELKEVNTILTEISKTSDLTKQQLVDLGNDSFETASKYGNKASNYLVGIQEMYRAGYENAEQLAELSTLAQSAGDLDAELANDYIIASDAAYGYAGNVEKLNTLLDSQNQVTNRNAVSMEELARATKVAANQLSNANIEENEMTALLGTGIATSREAGETVGRAAKGIIMNLQQVKGETGFDGEIIDEESLKKVEARCHSVGVELEYMQDGIARLRDPMEVLKELAEVYNSLPDDSAEKAGIIADIGGKYRGNVLSSILSNWDKYEKMLSDYENATGSAMNEAMKSANNWEGSLNRLSNTWTDTVGNIANSDAIIGTINFFNNLLSVVNKTTDALGSLGTIGLGAGLFASFKGAGRVKIAYPHLYTYACRNKTLYA